MRQQLILVCSLLFTITIVAQSGNIHISLEEAIAHALAHNRTAINASYDVRAAQKQKWEAIAQGLPQVNGSVEYQRFLKQQVQLIPSSAFGGPPGEFNAVTFGQKQSVNASATLSQLLFDGSYLVGLQSAKVFLEISENAQAKTALEVRKAVIETYGNVLLAEASLNILENNKKTLEKNLYEITKIYENGLEEEESVEQLKITLSGVESSLSNAIRLKKVAYQMLNMTLGQDIDTPIILTDTLDHLAQQNMNLGLLNSTYTVKNTIDYKIAKNDQTSKELLLKLEKSKNLPSLSAFVTGGYASYSDHFDFLNSNQKYYGYGLLGVNLKIPLFGSGLKKAKAQRAQINLEKATNNLTETAQRLKLQVASAKNDYQFAIDDYANKKENLNLAERVERKNQTKFYEGIGSSFELRQAQLQLYTAQQDFLKSMLDVITKKATLETLLNTVN